MKHTLFLTRRTVLLPEVCPCISIWAVMHHVDTGEAAVTSNKILHSGHHVASTSWRVVIDLSPPTCVNKKHIWFVSIPKSHIQEHWLYRGILGALCRPHAHAEGLKVLIHQWRNTSHFGVNGLPHALRTSAHTNATRQICAEGFPSFWWLLSVGVLA